LNYFKRLLASCSIYEEINYHSHGFHGISIFVFVQYYTVDLQEIIFSILIFFQLGSTTDFQYNS